MITGGGYVVFLNPVLLAVIHYCCYFELLYSFSFNKYHFRHYICAYGDVNISPTVGLLLTNNLSEKNTARLRDDFGKARIIDYDMTLAIFYLRLMLTLISHNQVKKTTLLFYVWL